jgi:hypothetical protein
MATTVIALFEEPKAAQTAVQALLAARFVSTDIDAVTEVDTHIAGEVADAVRHGAVVIAVRALGESGKRARAILEEAGAQRVDEHPFSWQQQGWEGFELNPSEAEVESTMASRERYREMNGADRDGKPAGPPD